MNCLSPCICLHLHLTALAHIALILHFRIHMFCPFSLPICCAHTFLSSALLGHIQCRVCVDVILQLLVRYEALPDIPRVHIEVWPIFKKVIADQLSSLTANAWTAREKLTLRRFPSLHGIKEYFDTTGAALQRKLNCILRQKDTKFSRSTI